jgi:PAS domain S-box-containing protein
MFKKKPVETAPSVKIDAESLPDGLFIVKKGKLEFVNRRAAEIFGYPVEAMMRMDFPDYAVSDDTCIIRGVRISRLSRGRTPESFEYEIKTPSGAKKNISLRMSFEKGETTFILARDVTERHLVESSLEEISLRFRELVEMLPQVVYEADLDMKLTYVNEFGFSMFGFTRDDFHKGLYIKDLMPFEEWNRAFAGIAKVMAGMTSHGKEYLARKKDGSVFPIELFNVPLIRSGVIAGMRGILIDRTERKKSENEIEYLRLSIIAIIHDIEKGIIIISNDDGHILVGNKRARDIVGYTKNWGTPVYVSDYFPEWKLLHYDRSICDFEDSPLKKGMRGEKIISENFGLVDPKGKEIWINVSIDPVKDNNGNDCATIVMFDTVAPPA